MSDLPPITQKFGADTTDFKTAVVTLNREIRVIEKTDVESLMLFVHRLTAGKSGSRKKSVY